MYLAFNLRTPTFTLDENFQMRTDGSGYCLLWLFNINSVEAKINVSFRLLFIGMRTMGDWGKGS